MQVRWLALHNRQSGLSQTVGHAQIKRVIEISDKRFTLTLPSFTLHVTIGVASYGVLGHVALDLQPFHLFSVYFGLYKV